MKIKKATSGRNALRSMGGQNKWNRVDLRSRCKSPGDCGDLNEKCLPRASCVWTFVPCWWHCLGVLWNLDEVVLLEEVHPSGQALRL